MVFTVQDRDMDRLRYISTLSSRLAAEDLVKELLEQDAQDGDLDENRYVITERGYCYADISNRCGWNTNCICMADDWETQCPARIRTGGKFADKNAYKGILKSAT